MLKNISSNWILTVLSIISVYILLPYCINKLGMEGYGTWTLIGSAVGYLGLLAIGAPMASVRFIAVCIGKKDIENMNTVISTFAGLYVGMGVVSLLGGLLIIYFFNSWFDVPEIIENATKITLVIVIFVYAFTFFEQLPSAIMSSYQEFVPKNIIAGIVILVRVGATILLLNIWPSIIIMALVMLLAIGLDYILSWAFVIKRHNEVQIQLKSFDKGSVKEIFSFSIYVMLLNVGAQLAFQTNALIVGAFMKVSDIPYYTVANSLTIYYMEFILGIAAVVFSVTANIQAKGDSEQLKVVFLKWSKISLTLSLIGGLYLIVLGPRFVAWWVGADFEKPAGEVLQILMFSFLIYLPVRGVAQPMLMALGKPKLPTIAFLITGIFNVILSIVLVKPYGLAGVAWGTAIPNIIFAIAVAVMCCRELHISFLSYVRYTLIKCILGIVPVYLLLIWMCDNYHIYNFIELFMAGLIMCAVFVLVWFFIVYWDDPFLNSKDQISRFKKLTVSKWF